MGEHFSPSRSVVVGIDGSHSAIDAALWAADEAVSRDVPLRLVYAIDPGNTEVCDATNHDEDCDSSTFQLPCLPWLRLE